MSRASRSTPDPGALRRSLGIVRPHLREHRFLMLGGLVALLAEVILRVLEPWPLKIVIDSVSASLGATAGANAGTPPATIGLLVACGAILLGLVGLRAITAYLSTIAFALVGSRVATALRARVFAHVQALSLRYHTVSSAGDTVQRLVGDIGRLQEVAVTAGLPLVGNVITLVVLTVVMLWLDPLLTLVVIGAAIVYLVSSRRSSSSITSASRSTRKGEGALADTAAQTLGAIRVVQAYGLEKEVGGAFDRGNATALHQGVKARRLAAALERRTDVIVGAATALVLAGGGWRVLEGQMTPGDLVVFTMYLKIAMRPLKDLAKYTGRIARAAASGERVADLLDEEIEVHDRPGARALVTTAGAVSFEAIGVDDGYGRALFTDLSLQLRGGESVCLLGASGAGKSTLVSLLVRASDPRRGRIAIDGTDLRDATLASLRSSISLLLQDSVLFATTVRENIRYGRLDASDADVEEAARRANALDFVLALPHGFETVLGERGGTLSGGQRQRIAIARALLRDAPVVVLDEATTGLDPEARAQVAQSLAELTRGRTTISITHDPAAIAGADRLLWLEDGRIVEDGTPEELLGRDSRVAAWFHRAAATEPGAEVRA
ncbi:ATP-binding cassette subfamily B protein [Rathayibacter sp. PhB93]|uniref:ABC transporter ATP-binding protein n=1 Tax=unclassified Rathayibacter TaxID=2609250 RepID=UPI000F46F316|nr:MULTISPECIES: ABC transporter ATP-binding protein [unclassified Rathayibacter]ROQ02087.1 ATP-binding cassette subfamily B protein [Rathayibacter sp. PhB93]TDQ07840.1 ATP-binding cassette subfamily B protein [Rathayibacter sp. PhB1]